METNKHDSTHAHKKKKKSPLKRRSGRSGGTRSTSGCAHRQWQQTKIAPGQLARLINKTKGKQTARKGQEILTRAKLGKPLVIAHEACLFETVTPVVNRTHIALP